MYFSIVFCWLTIFASGLVLRGDETVSEVGYTASTPAGNGVRQFLGISVSDSVDFIRWQLKIGDKRIFELDCRYGISKPNTNGFIAEKQVKLNGSVEHSNGRLLLKHNTKTLALIIVNDNILHLLNTDGSMMVGNGGWSYTLNAVAKLPAPKILLTPANFEFRDSLVLIGRTPCRGIEELIEGSSSAECYKKKWKLSLYKEKPASISGTYKLGVLNPKTGKWSLEKGKDNMIIYKLDLNNGNSLNLFQTDENIVYLIDPKGTIMVGDHDFSYSLNREMK